MSSAKFDPLEAAKLTNESAQPSAKAAAPSEAKAPSPSPSAASPATAAAPSTKPEAKASKPEAKAAKVEAPAAPAAPPPKKVKFKVLETKRVSVSGQITTFLEGRLLDPKGYGGEAGIKKLVSQGLKLDRVEV